MPVLHSANAPEPTPVIAGLDLLFNLPVVLEAFIVLFALGILNETGQLALHPGCGHLVAAAFQIACELAGVVFAFGNEYILDRAVGVSFNEQPINALASSLS